MINPAATAMAIMVAIASATGAPSARLEISNVAKVELTVSEAPAFPARSQA